MDQVRAPRGLGEKSVRGNGTSDEVTVRFVNYERNVVRLRQLREGRDKRRRIGCSRLS